MENTSGMPACVTRESKNVSRELDGCGRVERNNVSGPQSGRVTPNRHRIVFSLVQGCEAVPHSDTCTRASSAPGRCPPGTACRKDKQVLPDAMRAPSRYHRDGLVTRREETGQWVTGVHGGFSLEPFRSRRSTGLQELPVQPQEKASKSTVVQVPSARGLTHGVSRPRKSGEQPRSGRGARKSCSIPHHRCGYPQPALCLPDVYPHFQRGVPISPGCSRMRAGPQTVLSWGWTTGAGGCEREVMDVRFVLGFDSWEVLVTMGCSFLTKLICSSLDALGVLQPPTVN